LAGIAGRVPKLEFLLHATDRVAGTPLPDRYDQGRPRLRADHTPSTERFLLV
jgi:hypothetical protein